MKYLSAAMCAALMSAALLSATGCDARDINKPRTQTRTMIIGGVPVSDQDYQLLNTAEVSAKQR